MKVSAVILIKDKKTGEFQFEEPRNGVGPSCNMALVAVQDVEIWMRSNADKLNFIAERYFVRDGNCDIFPQESFESAFWRLHQVGMENDLIVRHDRTDTIGFTFMEWSK